MILPSSRWNQSGDEIAVGETLHQCRGAKTVRSVVREVGLASGVQTWDGRHEFVVDPEAAHGVVRGRVDAHRGVVRVFTSDPLVHIEQVSVTLRDGVFAESTNRFAEVEIYTVLLGPHALSGVDCTLRGS
jgi:hypothetical protein